jgi:type VI secretion system protein ImpL
MNAQVVWPYALGLVLLLAAIIVVLLVLVLRKSATPSWFSDSAEDEEPPEEPGAKAEHGTGADSVMISAAFRRARSILRSLTNRDQYRAAVHILIGGEGSREPGFLGRMSGADQQLAFDDPVRDGLAFGNGCGFYFLHDGVVLDMAGEHVLRSDGTGSDDRTWKSLLRHVRELRPKRPADGVIVTISCADLLAARKVEAPLAARADRLYRKLWDVQRELGFRLPVYVLITGCEQLEGFDDVSAALPETARGEMIGWSNPHAPTDPYNPAWLDDAFVSLHRDLGNLQMELFARAAESPGGVMLFPWAVGGLRKPLRTFLSHLFRSSAYHEGMMMRGFYLCGAQGTETAFAADLITRKVFPETGLAIPTSRTRMARDRNVRVLQIATAATAAVFTFGLIWAWLSFRHQNEVLKPVLENALRAGVQQSVAAGDVEIKDADEILDGMSKINFHRYGSIFVPSSWFSPFDTNLRNALAKTFTVVILDSIEAKLEAKVESALSKATTRVVDVGPNAGWQAPAREESDALLPIDDTPEFKSLREFVAALQQVELHGHMLNDLASEGHGELRGLGELVKFTFGHPLSDRFFRNGELYETALQNATATRPFDPEAFRTRANASAHLLSEDLYRRIYDRNPFALRLARLENALNSEGATSGSDPDDFRELAKTMRGLENDLAGPELQWAFRPGFDLGPSWNAVLAAMNGSRFFTPDAVESIRQRGLAGWLSFGHRIGTAATPYTGPILNVHDGKAEMRLSTDALVLQSAIESFVHQEFAVRRAPSANLVTSLDATKQMTWDPRLLQQAVSVHESYERFREKGLKLFDPALQYAVDSAARQQAAAQMQTLIHSAQRVADAPSTPTNAVVEQELQNGLDSFAANTKLIDQNAEILTGLDMGGARRELMAAMTAEAVRLLRLDDDLLERNPPYEPAADLAWHTATPAVALAALGGRDAAADPAMTSSPSPGAFGARDAAELALYLDVTRDRLKHLSRTYAKPLLAWMARAGTDKLPENAELVRKWQTILDDLDEYDSKKPGNAGAALEDYIRITMAKVTMKDCTASVLTTPPQYEHYLGTKLDRLARKVTDVCWTKAAYTAAQRYTKVAELFNDRLAGRYPFADKLPASVELEADIDDIRRFYRLFDESDKLISSIPTDGDYSQSLREAREFLDDMREVRKFFAAYLDPVKAKSVVDVETQFRTLQSQEHAGNEIIQWTLSLGAETIKDREKAKKPLPWRPSDPVRLTLLWAQDAPNVPVLPVKRRGMTVLDRTVTFEYTNRWSLLAALSDLKAAETDLGAGVDAPPVTLSLLVQRKAAPDPNVKPAAAKKEALPPAPQPTQVFMRLALLTPDGEPVKVPQFPVSKAPAIEHTMLGEIR